MPLCGTTGWRSHLEQAETGRDTRNNGLSEKLGRGIFAGMGISGNAHDGRRIDVESRLGKRKMRLCIHKRADPRSLSFELARGISMVVGRSFFWPWLVLRCNPTLHRCCYLIKK